MRVVVCCGVVFFDSTSNQGPKRRSAAGPAPNSSIAAPRLKLQKNFFVRRRAFHLSESRFLVRITLVFSSSFVIAAASCAGDSTAVSFDFVLIGGDDATCCAYGAAAGRGSRLTRPAAPNETDGNRRCRETGARLRTGVNFVLGCLVKMRARVSSDAARTATKPKGLIAWFLWSAATSARALSLQVEPTQHHVAAAKACEQGSSASQNERLSAVSAGTPASAAPSLAIPLVRESSSNRLQAARRSRRR
jgi:hypothetical protein